MSTRLQVIVSDEEMISLRQAARRRGLTVGEWARQVLRRVRTNRPVPARRRLLMRRSRLRALERALACNHLTGDIGEMLADIERGRDLR